MNTCQQNYHNWQLSRFYRLATKAHPIGLGTLMMIIIIIIERKDIRGIMSNDCKDTLQTQNKTVRMRCSRMSKVSIRYRQWQSCRNQESFWRTVPSSADAWCLCSLTRKSHISMSTMIRHDIRRHNCTVEQRWVIGFHDQSHYRNWSYYLSARFRSSLSYMLSTKWRTSYNECWMPQLGWSAVQTSLTVAGHGSCTLSYAGSMYLSE